MGDRRIDLRCARCASLECRDGKDCFGLRDEHRAFYAEDALSHLHRAATAIEGRHYCEATRLEEIIRFAKELGCRSVGLAYCVGLSSEARAVDEILRRDFDVQSVCCKACGVDKAEFGLEQIDAGRSESICNSMGQADLLNRARTDLNIALGLCVGHDAIFSAKSEAPVTTLATKDRVLAHNPLAAIYCQYVRRRI